jgi:hypothetical protein
MSTHTANKIQTWVGTGRNTATLSTGGSLVILLCAFVYVIFSVVCILLVVYT